MNDWFRDRSYWANALPRLLAAASLVIFYCGCQGASDPDSPQRQSPNALADVPIAKLVIVHDNGGDYYQSGHVMITDIEFDLAAVATGDGYVEGTGGDDLIDVAYTGDPEGDMIDNSDALLPGEAPEKFADVEGQEYRNLGVRGKQQFLFEDEQFPVECQYFLFQGLDFFIEACRRPGRLFGRFCGDSRAAEHQQHYPETEQDWKMAFQGHDMRSP